MELEILAKNKLILLYLVWVIFGGVLFWFGSISIIWSYFYGEVPSWYPDFLVYVDELMVIAGAILLALALVWLKKNWSKF